MDFAKRLPLMGLMFVVEGVVVTGAVFKQTRVHLGRERDFCALGFVW